MVDPAVEDILIHNQDALEELTWAIEASQGQFSLTLARCNYTSLRSQLVTQIQQACTVKLLVTPLKQGSKTLYTRLRELTDSTPVEALMVLGLESVDDLKDILPAVNSVREEFRKNFPFPIVLWTTDEVHSKLVQLAPDFESWATTTDFTLPLNALLDALRDASDRLFSTLLTPDSNYSFRRLSENLDLGFLQRSEVEAAIRDVQKTGQPLAPDLQATLDFLRGLNAPTNQEALEHFQRSLEYWQQVASHATSHTSHPTPHLIAGLLLYFVGRSLYNICSENKYRQKNWEPPKQPLQNCLVVFEQANRPDLVAKSITQLERVFDRLQAWEKLEALAQKSLPLQQTYNDRARQAQDYRYLALTAIQRKQGAGAKHYAEQALEMNEQVSEDQRYRGLYLLTLAEATKLTGQRDAALARLNEARALGDQGIPRVYIAILEELRTHYIEQKDYLEAFRLKQERLSVEQQYQLRAFVGAGRLRAQRQDQEALRSQNVVGTTDRSFLPTETPITGIASWQRQRDVKQLVERIGRNDCKLIVIHGYSGVGKSSLISAGLVPTLEQKAIGIQPNLPVVVRKYTDWAEELGRRMAEVLGKRDQGGEKEAAKETGKVKGDTVTQEHGDAGTVISPPYPLPTLYSLITQLRHNEQRNLRTIMIFDQFEEFFFVYPTPALRRPFFEFLGQCLQLLSVKVVLPLREDYLYYLLEFNRIPEISATGIDVLSRNVLYPLGNFAPDDARVIIQELTEQARFYLEPSLVEALVTDLTDENGEVRPIELQIVGAQLQTDDIRDLETYDKLREAGKPAKEVLVGRYLAEVVADCGTDNQRAAELVLYLLTDGNDTRPLKTRAELVEDMNEEASKLDFVLEILVRSGLVMLLPEVPADRYQLVHDYLVRYIRQDQGEDLLQQLAQERVQRKVSDEKLKRFLKQALLASMVAGLGFATLSAFAIGAAYNADAQRKRAEVSETDSLRAYSEALLSSHQDLEALIAISKASQHLSQKKLTGTGVEDGREQIISTFQRVLSGINEINRLEQQGMGQVYRAVYSPNGKLIASAGADNTVKLWTSNGQLLTVLGGLNKVGHKDEVTSISFSPDGRLIASSSADKTVKIWNLDGSLLRTLNGHSDVVIGISFSPNSKILASASRDRTIKLWQLSNGGLLKTLKGHKEAVTSISFSPDGNILASASGDTTLKLWSLNGDLLKTLKGHSLRVRMVKFSSDGKTLASASLDKTLKLWNFKTGRLLTTFYGHNDGVYDVDFSRDGKIIVSASGDKTIRLWKLDGTLIQTIEGHQNSVYSTVFSPQGTTLLSSSADQTIRIWRYSPSLLNVFSGSNVKFASVSFSPKGNLISAVGSDKAIWIWSLDGSFTKTIKAHDADVYSISFSPNGKLIASAGGDKVIKLWSTNGTLLKVFKGHTADVRRVIFSSDGQLIVSGSADDTVKIWRIDGTLLATLKGHRETVRDVAFSPDGKLIASASSDKTVRLWNLNGRLLKTFEGHTNAIRGVAFSPNNKWLASGSLDKTIRIWNLEEGRLLKTLEGHKDGVLSVAFSPNGKVLASAGRDRQIKLWNLEDGSVGTISGHKDAVTEVSYSPDGKILVSASTDTTVRLWNLDAVDFILDARFDSLLGHGCYLIQDYLKNNPSVEESDRHLCDGIPQK